MCAQRCPTQLISDAPAGHDAFGGHEGVARSIIETVLTEKGGRSIALEGRWGSGKSTIVKLVSHKLAETDNRNVRVAVFDAWAHQGDPLRRTFLENLVQQMQEAEWIGKRKWDEKLSELAHRKREEIQRVMPRLTKFGIWFAVSLLGIPIGSAMISAGATLLASAEPTTPLARSFLGLGVVFILFPALVVVVAKAARKVRARDQSDDETLGELPALISGQLKTETRTTVVQTPDPTSVEFEREFQHVLDEALNPEDRKLVLVVDNLDRVNPSDALSIWSTLQTFLGHKDYQRPGWLDRLWILVPFDTESILPLWKGQDTNHEETDTGTRRSLAVSFLDKIFQIKFRVPPVLVSNWQKFLQEMLHQAFPSHELSDFHDVYRAFAARSGLEYPAPTPRDLKLFVNQIGALHRERQDEFPLSCLASYVLLQLKHVDVHKVVLSKDEPEFLRRIVGSEWRNTMAALHFGVSIAEGQQLLLRDPIQTALAHGDGKTLSTLAATHPTGFWPVLEDAVPAGQARWDTLSPLELASAATAMVQSGLFAESAEEGRREVRTMRRKIREVALAVEAWNPFNHAVVQGMLSLCQAVEEPEEIVSALLRATSRAAICDAKEKMAKPEQEHVLPGEWLGSALNLVRGLDEQGHRECLHEGVEVPLSAEQWIEAMGDVSAEGQGSRFLRHLRLPAIAEIDEVLAQRIAAGQLDENLANLVQASLATQSGNTMKNTPQALLSQVSSAHSIQAEQLTYLLRILRLCRTAGLIYSEQDQAKSVTPGHYLHHLHQAASQGHAEATAACIYEFLGAVPDGTKPKPVGNSEAGYQTLDQLLKDPDKIKGLADQFAGLAEEGKSLSLILSVARTKQPPPLLLTRSLRTLLDSPEIPKPPELVKGSWEVIRDVMEKDKDKPQRFVDFLSGLPDLDELVGLIVAADFDVVDSGLYVALLSSDAHDQMDDWCAKSLSSVDHDTWVKTIESQADLLDVLIALKERRVSLTLGVPYCDALVTYTREVAEGQKIALSEDKLEKVFGLLTEQQRRLFARRAYEVLEELGGETAEQFFNLVSNMLPGAQELTGEKRFVDKVCRPILEARNLRGLVWLADVLAEDPTLLEQHTDQAAVHDFHDRLHEALRTTEKGDPALQAVRRMAEVLGIQRDEETSEETEAEAKGQE